MVERNWYLIKRYAWWEIAFFFWTAANTLTIVFIAKGVEATGGKVDIDKLTTVLLIGAVMWSYLGIVFELLIETVAWERWEGTIEYTFMAPLTRATHLLGTGIFAIGYGIVRASIVFVAIAAFFGLHMPNANFATALVLIAVASVSFVGIGMMTAVLPLISPEKGTQFGYTLVWVLAPVYFVTAVGMSPLQLVLVGTFMELTVFLCEVPTGIVADVYGRRLSVVIGFVVMGAAIVFVGAVPEAWAIIAGWSIWGFGYTFTS